MKKTVTWILILMMLLPAGAVGEESLSGALRERVDGMWEIWSGSWSRTFLDGEVYLPYQWKQIPFVTWADEAPTLRVEEEGEVRISFSEPIGGDWRVCLGEGMPIEYRDCAYDPESGCWTGGGSFDGVYLISDMTETRIGISVAYQRTDEFRPSCPVLSWIREEEGAVLGMCCYGWGTTRGFQGGMYAVATDEAAFYGEYDGEGALCAWYDAMTGCRYDAKDRLEEGEEPEGYVSPVVH